MGDDALKDRLQRRAYENRHWDMTGADLMREAALRIMELEDEVRSWRDRAEQAEDCYQKLLQSPGRSK